MSNASPGTSRLQRRIVATTASILLAAAAGAISYAPLTDEQLADQAAVIVEFDILDVLPALPEHPYLVETEYVALASRVVKGSLRGSTFAFRVLGGVSKDRSRSVLVPGIPELAPGDKALGFFVERQDHTLGLLHLGLGLFHLGESGDGPLLALPHVRASSPASSADGPALERDLESFVRWLEDRGDGIHRAQDYLIPVDDVRLGIVREESSALINRDGLNARWFEFEQGRSVQWRANPTDSLGSLPAFAAAIGLWNNERTTNVQYAYVGETNDLDFSQGQASRAEGLLVFGDPVDVLDGTVVCAGPNAPTGVLAAAVFLQVQADDGTMLLAEEADAGRAAERRRFQNRDVWVIAAAVIVVNDGMGCFLSGGSQANKVEIFAHELGHTLGIGHSCGDEAVRCPKVAQDAALMRAEAHLDNRHNRLYPDDIASLKSLYLGSAGGGGGALLAPTNLTAVGAPNGEVDLFWQDNSTGELLFRVHVKRPGANWQNLGTLPAESTGALVTGAQSGVLLSFRVRAERGKQRSPWSNIASARPG